MKNQITYLSDIKNIKKILLADIKKIANVIGEREELKTDCEWILQERKKSGEAQFKKLKSGLPAICVNIFNEANNEGIKEHLDFISFDIDHINNLEEIKYKLKQDEHIILLYKSISGEGLKGIVQFERNTKIEIGNWNLYHLHLFNNLKNYFSIKYNIIIDDKCKDVSRKMFLAHDPDVYYNENWIKMKSTEYKPEQKRTPGRPQKVVTDTVSLSGILNWLQETKISLCEDYQTYLNVGFVCAGLNDEQLFHTICSYSKKYNENECSAKFNNLVKNYNEEKSPNIKYLFKIAQEQGYKLSPEEFKNQKLKWGNADIETMLNLEGIKFSKNIISNKIYVTVNGETLLLDDEVMNWVLNILRKKYKFPELQKRRIEEMLDYKNVSKFNPILDLLEENKTNDDSEFNKLLNSIKIEDPEISKNLIKRWMLGTFNNMFNPNKYYEEMLIFTGGQGAGKTYWIENILLAPFKNYIDSQFQWDEKNKDCLTKMATKLFIFDDELSASKKAEIETIKTMTSYSEISFRMPYATYEITKKRLATFIACTNENNFYSDMTGNRRFLPIEVITNENKDRWVDDLDINSIKAWGYIYNEWKNGLSFKDIKIENLEAKQEQYRTISDDELILKQYLVKTENEWYSLFDIKQQIKELFNINLYSNAVYVGKVFKKMGIEQKQFKINGQSVIKYKCKVLQNEQIIKEERMIDLFNN